MANESTGSTKDLSSSRIEALQDLLSSLRRATVKAGSTHSGVPQDQLQELSDRIEELLVDESLQRNRQAQLSNDNGDPIVEITEPATEISEAPAYFHEPDLIPLHSLSPAERERRRRERERILDILEEEERLQQIKERREEDEKAKENMRQRMESAKSEYERLKQAQLLQKKMGKALLGGSVETGESGHGSENSVAQKPAISKKTVTFSDTVMLEPTTSATEGVISSGEVGWGDITAGRLRSSTRVPLASTASADKYPMKVLVVERRRPDASMPTLENVADSDDESPVPSSPPHHSEEQDDNEDHNLSGQDTGSNEDESSVEPLDEVFDFDSAQHQREIAVEYFAKRHGFGSGAAQAMATYRDSGDDPEFSYVSPQHTQESIVSHFRADRMASAYDKSRQHQPCTSLGSSIVPEARQKSIRNAIRVGKLENGQLTGGPSGDSGSEDDETRETTELLKRGDVRNVGPNFSPASSSYCPSSQDPPPFVVAANHQRSESGTSREDSGRHTSMQSTSTSPRSVVSGIVERKPQRPPSSQAFTVNKSRRHQDVAPSIPPDSTLSLPRKGEISAFSNVEPSSSMIVESPSFVRPKAVKEKTSRSIRPPVVMSSAVKESSASGRSPADVSAAQKKTSKFMAERQG
ncbi:hypothetical protein V8B97DRAFT_1941047 [Scleroderma yunnanense]